MKAPKTKLQTPEKFHITSSNAGDVPGRIGILSLGFLWCLELGVWCFDIGDSPSRPSDGFQGSIRALSICALYTHRPFPEAPVSWFYGEAKRRDADREGHAGTAGHQNHPAPVARRLQPRVQDRPVHHSLLARYSQLQTRLLALLLRARPRLLRDDRETRWEDGHADRGLGEGGRPDVRAAADRK